MDENIAISVKNVGMRFILNKEKVDNLKEYFIKFVTKKLEYNEFWALRDIDFEVKKGDHLAILGFNGAGKSTLLKAIVGVYKPTVGKVETQGIVAPLLELGAGFDPNYTGKENIYLYGAILGYSREYLRGKMKEIIEFSELGHFIDVPIKNYSSGMKARLGFSIATAVEPDILILDEVLSVGDANFREKSLAKIQSLFESGVTVIFVSHNIQQVKEICDRAILLEHGRCIAQGDVNDVAAIYEKMSAEKKAAQRALKRKTFIEPEYKLGQTYSLNAARGLYIGCGAYTGRKLVSDLPETLKPFALPNHNDAYLKKGTKITVEAIEKAASGNLWVLTEGGWICVWEESKNKNFLEEN